MLDDPNISKSVQEIERKSVDHKTKIDQSQMEIQQLNRQSIKIETELAEIKLRETKRIEKEPKVIFLIV
jgi:hypothetical protein